MLAAATASQACRKALIAPAAVAAVPYLGFDTPTGMP
jgi:hypothetical protein